MFCVFIKFRACKWQGRSQDCFRRGSEAQTKFSVRSQNISVRSGDIQKNLLNKDF